MPYPNVCGRVASPDAVIGLGYMPGIDFKAQQPLRRWKRPNCSIQKSSCSTGRLQDAGWTKAVIDQQRTHATSQLRRRLKVAELSPDSGPGPGRQGSPHSQDAIDSPCLGDRATVLQPPLQGVRDRQISDLGRVREDFFRETVRLDLLHRKQPLLEEGEKVVHVAAVLDDPADVVVWKSAVRPAIT